MVSFASEDSSHNVDKVNSKLKQVLKEHGLSKETLRDSEGADNFLVTRERHRVLLEQTMQCLDNFLQDDLQVDMAAEELR